ncbi:S13A1 protein, partial [Polypterus senegalus]
MCFVMGWLKLLDKDSDIRGMDKFEYGTLSIIKGGELECTEAECAYTLFIVAVYWLSEAMPLAVTALIPALMFPLFGILKSKMVAAAYFKDFHLLLIGVICLATSIEKWNLHKRIALRMVMLLGVNPGWLMLGFMLSSAFLSMWLSNTSTAAMVMPIVEAVIQQILKAEAEVNTIHMKRMNGTANPGLQLNEMHGKYRSKKDHMMCKGMSLCIAYASTIGGLTTITGTSTNLIFAEHFNNFTGMCNCSKEKTVREQASARVIKEEYKALGPMSYKGYATDSTAALVLGLLFFIIPAHMPTSPSSGKKNDYSYSTLISWKEFQACMPWEIALLVGGGFALAEGSEVSGLSAWVGSKLTPLGSLPLWVTIIVSSLIVTTITEIASNPATITIFLPILSPLAEAIHINPLYILIPTTLCTSFAFLLPVANPPNAIVFTYGHLRVIDMVKAGLGVNIIGVAVVMLAVSTWGTTFFNLKEYPSWAPAVPTVNITGP